MNSTQLKVRVRYAEVDRGKVAYHGNYFVWLDMARTEFLREHGISYKSLEEQGYFFVVAETSCRYLAPVGFDDEIVIQTFLKTITRRTVEFEYEIKNQNDPLGKIISKAYTKLVVVNSEWKIANLPENVLNTLEQQ